MVRESKGELEESSVRAKKGGRPPMPDDTERPSKMETEQYLLDMAT